MPSSPTRYARGLVWFRRDLRVADQAALYRALTNCEKVWCVFVFDTDILDPLLACGLKRDRRVEFIHSSIEELSAELAHAGRHRGRGLIVRHGRAREVIPALAEELGVDAVFVNHDYDPAATARDSAVEKTLRKSDRDFLHYKDQVIFEKDEIVTQEGTAFTVFTPYKNAWLKALTPLFVKSWPVERYADQLAPIPHGIAHDTPTLPAMGFEKTNLSELDIPTGASGASKLFDDFRERIDSYRERRDFPGVKGPSYLSVHLRFGTISIRALARAAHERALHGPAAGERGAETWLSELIWRDFYFQILHHRPDVADGASFKAAYDRIRWASGPHADKQFATWCAGATGYPLVDAAMTQINTSGYMHNRLRMVTASFLAKDLGIDWRRGEQYFADQLNDFDLSANNGGWQWAASSGCDAQPYFRIFNPVTQSEKFDADGHFIRRYLPRLAKLSNKAIHAPWLADAAELKAAGIVLGRDYPEPIVMHNAARKATLERYAVVKAKGSVY